MVEDTPLDPAASAALIAEQRAKVEAAVDVDGRILFGAWGVAWLLGFGLVWLVAVDRLQMSAGAAMVTFIASLAGAGAVTAWHLTVKSRRVRGTSARQGAMYGWSWFLSFGVVAALGVALDRAGAGEEAMGVAMMVSSLLVVGAWICVSTIAAALVGSPHMYLVICIAGGGGMLVAAAAEAVRRRSRARACDG